MRRQVNFYFNAAIPRDDHLGQAQDWVRGWLLAADICGDLLMVSAVSCPVFHHLSQSSLTKTVLIINLICSYRNRPDAKSITAPARSRHNRQN